MAITLREASSAADHERAVTLMHDIYVGEGWTAADAARSNVTADRLSANGIVLLAEEDGALLGTTLFLHADSAMRQLARDHEREFRLLAVSPVARGRGVGEMLVRDCMARAQAGHASGLVLWTQPRMLAAQRLYERLGFVREHARDVPDPRGFMRLVYVRPLDRASG